MSTATSSQGPLTPLSSLLRPFGAAFATVQPLIDALLVPFNGGDLGKLYRLATNDSVNPEVLAELDALANRN